MLKKITYDDMMVSQKIDYQKGGQISGMTSQSYAQFVRFREIEQQMTSAEKKVADYICANMKDVLQMSITELAQKSESSESTIVRLCKKAGLRGFPELRLLLAQHAAPSANSIHESVTIDDPPDQIVRKVFQAAVQALNETESILSGGSFEEAVTRIRQAESISFFGIGASGVIATDAYYRFSRLGIPCHVATDSQSQTTRAIFSGERDVIIAISHSGRTRDIIRAVDVAKRHGAFTIAITQFGNSPITEIADLVLHTSSSETIYRTEAMASRIAQSAILDSLFVAVSMTRYDEVLKNMEKARKVTAELRINHIRELYRKN